MYIPEDLHRDAKLMASNLGVNFSSLVREGLKVVVEKKRKKAKKKDPFKTFVGKGKTGGPKDLSSKIDYYLYGDGNPKWK